LNLAAAFAMAGQSTVLLEADVHRPSLARALGISVERSVGDVLSQRASVEHALVSLPHFGGRLRGLFAKPTDAGLGDLFALAPGEQLLTDLRARADVVVVDSAPALRVGDTLQLVGKVDDVVLVVRLGVTKSEELRRLLELFDQQRMQPIGLVLIGTGGADNGYYGYVGQARGFEPPAGVLNSVAVGQRTVRPRVYRERRINS
jgi:succinoglycan biosynthesis transport protein ExoP